jgi:hypothetical protein
MSIDLGTNLHVSIPHEHSNILSVTSQVKYITEERFILVNKYIPPNGDSNLSVIPLTLNTPIVNSFFHGNPVPIANPPLLSPQGGSPSRTIAPGSPLGYPISLCPHSVETPTPRTVAQGTPLDQLTPSLSSWSPTQWDTINPKAVPSICPHPMVFPNLNNNSAPDPAPVSPVVNLSSLQLTEPMISLLSKGLNFCPTPGETDVYQLRRDLDQFHLNLKRKQFFAKDNEQATLTLPLYFSPQLSDSSEPQDGFDHQKFREKSSWSPLPPSQLEAMIIFNESMLNEYTPMAPAHHNLTKLEKHAMQTLKHNTNIVIKPADKGSSVVIQNKTDYIKEGLRQLGDTKFYVEVPTDLTDQHNKEVDLLIDRLLLQNEISKKCADYLHNPQPRTAQLYLLPKIHKNTSPVPGRPIVSANNCPTERISQLVDHFLQPLVSKTKSYVKDTTDFLHKISQIKDLPTNSILCTVDVTSLYTNIPNTAGIEACRKFLNLHRLNSNSTDTKPHTESLMDCLKYVLTKNNFDFNGKHYLQVGGTAMGTKVAPSFANLFMADFEDTFVYTYPHQPHTWYRYIDDIFMIWTHGQDNLNQFLENLNNCHDTIKFTVEHSTSSVNFLDTTVLLDKDGSLYTDLYCKPTDTHNYLSYDSAHPTHTKTSLPYSQFLRVRRICSRIEDFDSNAIMIAKHFKRRGYPNDTIEEALILARRKDRESLLQPPSTPKERTNDDNLFLIRTYHPCDNPLKDIIHQNWKVLGRTHTTESLYNQRIIFGNRRNKNLRDLLVRAALPPENPASNTTNVGMQPLHTCHKINCRYCNHLDLSGTITSYSTGRTYYSRKLVSCQSNNIIYCLSCTRCNLQYVGQTKNRLADRFAVHFNHIEPIRAPRKKPKIQTTSSKFFDPIGRHFKSIPHNGLKDVKIHILHFIDAPSNSTPAKLLRDDMERMWIHRLKTLSPKGLNLMD